MSGLPAMNQTVPNKYLNQISGFLVGLALITRLLPTYAGYKWLVLFKRKSLISVIGINDG